MNKKYIQRVIIFVLLALILLGGAWLYSRDKQGRNLRGKPAFATTKEKIKYLGNIKIVSSENGEINIYRLEDGSWRFKEAKEYFVNEEMLSAFFRMIKDAIIMSAAVKPVGDFLENNNLTAEKGIILQTYDYEGNLLDNVIIGGQTGQDQRWVLKSGKKNYAYAVSEMYGISDSPQDWIPYPLLNLNPADIKFISINGEKTDVKEFGRKVRRKTAWRNLVKTLSFLEYYGLSFKSDLANLPPDTQVRQIDVRMLTGMVYKLTVLYVDDSYWIVISMDADHVFTKDAVDVAVDTYRYYADWVFRLSDEQGKILFADDLLD